MRFNIKKLKGETLMLELLPGIEEREKPGRKPAKITDMGTPIFERIHARTMAAIDKSIEEANFRFHSKGQRNKEAHLRVSKNKNASSHKNTTYRSILFTESRGIISESNTKEFTNSEHSLASSHVRSPPGGL